MLPLLSSSLVSTVTNKQSVTRDVVQRSFRVDHSPTGNGPAVARDGRVPIRESIVNQQFLLAIDFSKALNPRAFTADAESAVGLARMIDQFGPAAAYGPVETPIAIDSQEVGCSVGIA